MVGWKDLFNIYKETGFIFKNKFTFQTRLAAYIYQRAMEYGYDPCITKIQRWLFICYGLYLAMNDDYSEPLFDERPMCWPYGPVFVSVPHPALTKSFSNVRISKKESQGYKELVEIVLDYFGSWTSSELCVWTMNGASYVLARHRDDNVPIRIPLDIEEIRHEFRGYLASE